MAIRIFISHSVTPRELVLVDSMGEEAAKREAIAIIPDRNWAINKPIPKRIKSQIEDSDFIIAIATEKGHHSKWLNEEIAYSQKLTPAKTILLVADDSIEIDPSFERILINRRNPIDTISKVSNRIKQLVQDKKTQDFLAGLLVAGLVLLLLSSLQGE